MSYKASWLAPSGFTDNTGLGGLSVEYEYRDTYTPISGSQRNGQSLDTTNLSTPNYTEPAYGTLIEASLIATGSGVTDSDAVSASLRVNSPPVATGHRETLRLNQLASVSSVNLPMSYIDADSSESGYVVGSWELLDNPSHAGIFTMPDTGSGLIVATRPTSGWPVNTVGQQMTVDARYTDQFGASSIATATIEVVSNVNNPPSARNNITFSYVAGASAEEINLDGYFTDEDNSLTYVLVTDMGDMSSIAFPDGPELSISGNMLTITPGSSAGTFAFAIKGTDSGGLSDTTTGWTVSVSALTRKLRPPRSFSLRFV